MEKSIVYVENIYAEDLFKWFYEHVGASSGDGAGVIVCKNYHEVADLFIKWWKEEYSETENFRWWRENCPGREFFHDRDEYHNIINFHDNNENFMFTDDINISMCSGDYIFIVKKDCVFGFSVNRELRILGVENEI